MTNGQTDSVSCDRHVETGESSGSQPADHEDAAAERTATRRQFKMPEVSPEQTANIISRVFFWWLRGLLWQGYKQPLEEQDLWPLMARDSASTVRSRFKNTAQKENENAILNGTRHSLAHLLFLTFKMEYMITAILRLVGTALLPLPTLLLNSTLLYIEERAHKDLFMHNIFGRYFGYYAAGGLFFIPFVKGLVENQFYIKSYLFGNRVRVSLISSLYEKTLRLSTAARQKKSVGETVTLMQVDAVKVGDMIPFIHLIWSGLLEIGMNVAMLVYFLGPSALVGIAFIFFTLPIQTTIINKMIACQKDIMMNTGERVKVLNEVIQGIRVVKSSAWEKPFKAAVEEKRQRELRAIVKRVFLRAGFSTVMLATPLLIMVVTFTFYLKVQKGDFRASIIFTAVALFTSLRQPLIMYPMTITSIISAHVSVKRIEAFLNLDNVKPHDILAVDTSGGDSAAADDKGPLYVVEMEGDFQWITLPPDLKKSKSSNKAAKGSSGKCNDLSDAKNLKKGKWDEKTQAAARSERAVVLPTDLPSKAKDGETDLQKGEGTGGPDTAAAAPFGLTGIWLRLKRGEMIAVVGPVGCGKSSLVSALLGDMEQKKGSPLKLRGTVAYCSQQAWIMNATLRDNILFGKTLDETKYNAIISACALEQDLDSLMNGDLTEIGERGINLSGGQKQRISLARAAYADADIYVLDDPLSAVDAHVGAHLFKHCINGILADKARIFVTNQLQFVPEADTVIVLKEGRIEQQGAYKELMQSGMDFSKLMKDTGAHTASTSKDKSESSKDGMKDKDSSSDNLEGIARQQSNKNGASKGTLVEAESRAVGRLKFELYKTYWTLASKYTPFGMLILYTLSQSIEVMSTFWLAYWTNDEFKKPQSFYLGVYAGFGGLYACSVFFCVTCLYIQSLWTSKILHAGLLDSVLRGSMEFFDTTPVGRILNRFSNDVSLTDELLPMAWNMTLIILFMVLGALVAIMRVTPWFVLVLLPVGSLYAFTQQIYRKTGRELKRLEAVTKSPLNQQFSETLNGLTTIRAYQAEKRFIEMHEEKMDLNSKTLVLLRTCDRWLSLWMEVLGSIIVSAAAFLAINRPGKDDAGLAGVSIQYSLVVVTAVGMLMRTISDTENQMNGVERILDYQRNIQCEGPFVVEDNRPPKDWPSKGAIQFNNISMRYREGLPLVLKNVSLSFAGGEKVGLVGRTGSGKSSLTVCLFRLVEPVSGHVVIDGIQTKKIGLEDLRSRLSIIPQDPVLFSGTVRSNLDPFNLHSDDILWEALRQSHLKDKVSTLPLKLESTVVEYGENFSAGERQLLCLARVLLRRSKIIVMDEATSSVDYETDKLIQATIRQHMKESTILVIAHRIHTVIDASTIVLMADGQVAECGEPASLLDNPMGKFTALVRSNGEQTFAHLLKMARGELDFFSAYENSSLVSLEVAVSPSPSTENLQDVQPTS